MLKWLRRGALTLVVLVVLAVLAVQALRWSAYGDEERAAVALASVPPPEATGRNGYAALALSEYEVPADRIDAELAADVRAFAVWLEGQGEQLVDASRRDEATLATWKPALADRYPARAGLDHDSPLCRLGPSSCLETVRSDTGAIRDFMAGESARLALMDQVLAADHLHSPYPSSHQAPLPPYAALRLPLTQAAIDAVDGRVPEALDRTCRTLAGARRFAPDARHLVDRMFFPALAEGAAALLLDIRRAHPDAVLPDDCRDALRPVQAEDFLICEAMRGEFRMGAAFSARQEAALAGDWRPASVFSRTVLMDRRLHDAWLAPVFAAPCTDDYREEVLAGRVPPPPPRPVSRGDLHCYAAAINCLLAEIALPAYGDYQGRQLDHAARLRALLAANAVLGTDAQADALAAAAASPGYDVHVDAAARTLTVPLRFQRGKADAEFSVSY